MPCQVHGPNGHGFQISSLFHVRMLDVLPMNLSECNLDCYFHIPDQLQFQPLYASCRTLQVDKSQDQTCASNLYQPDCKLDTCGTVSEYRGIEPVQHSIDQKSNNHRQQYTT